MQNQILENGNPFVNAFFQYSILHSGGCRVLIYPDLSPLLSIVCNCDLARSGFFQKKGEYICTTDYQRLYGTRCDRCDSFITGEVVSALGRTYHPKCFVCSVCRYMLTHSIAPM